jgi:hypothetical protein
MIGDLDISGVFLPTLLVLMGITYVLFVLVHGVLTRLHFYRLVWHRALFNVASTPLLARGLTQSIPDDMKKPFDHRPRGPDPVDRDFRRRRRLAHGDVLHVCALDP